MEQTPFYATNHVLMVEPNGFCFNDETGPTNAFQHRPNGHGREEIAARALQQHRALRDLLTANGVYVTLLQSAADTPDAPFCNNWFSTHPAMKGFRDLNGYLEEDTPETLVLYPLMAENRRRERRPDLIDGLFRRLYPRVVNMAHHEAQGRFLESTGSLCMHDAARTVYAALSPRTDRELAGAWADRMGYRLVAFHATDAAGMAYYHTNVMMFIGHSIAGVCLESVEDRQERKTLEESLATGGLEVLAITREQVANFCGNAISIVNQAGDRLLVMSTRAWENFTADQQARLSAHARVLHSDLSVIENIGGGSARCLIGELF